MKVLAPINENEDAVDKKYVDDSIKNGTLTIQKNGTNVQTFTANQSTNATANITVPTKTSELTNDSGYTTNTGIFFFFFLQATSPIAIDSDAAITTSGTRTLSHANSGVTAGTYRSVTVNATGHVTAGTNPTTISGYGITDAKIASGTITLGSNTITPAIKTEAIKNITRSGTTFTATRCDDTTFTFTQQDNNTVPAAYCDTAAGTAAKTASCTGYSLAANTYLHIIIVNSNTSANALTLNVNGKGAKPIYINDAVTSSTNYTLPAGSYICYYDGTNYYFNTDGKLPGQVSEAAYHGVDTIINIGTTSTSLPTSAAVVDYINSMGYGSNNVYVGTSEPSSPDMQLWVDPTGMLTAKNSLYVSGAIYLEGTKLFWYE